MTDLNDVLGKEVDTMIRSWMAWSATNIIFRPDGKLLLGVRSNAEPRAIPEPGDLALIGGFNTVVDGPAMWRDAADAHAKAQLGIELTPEQCSGFLPCEYEMADIPEPLKTPQGALHIKRVAFDRVVMLSDEQVSAITPQGKLRDAVWTSQEEFDQMVGNISFPFQVAHVTMAFELVDGYIEWVAEEAKANRSIPVFSNACMMDWN